MILDAVEYLPEGSETFDYLRTGPFEAAGIGPRDVDGQACLTVRSIQHRRALAIPVGAILAVTVEGRRHLMRTPYGQSRLRTAELRRIIEGVTEDWAVEAFDPDSSAFFETAFAGHPTHYIDYPNIVACSVDDAFRTRPPSSARRRAGVAILMVVPVLAALALTWVLAAR